MKVKVTEYRGFLAIEALEPEVAHPDWAPIGPGRFGCVVNNTRLNMGASPEAIAAIRKLPRSRDSIGSLMWFARTPKEEGAAFGWMGGALCFIGSDGDTCRDTRIQEGQWVPIQNDTSAVLREAIDSALEPEKGASEGNF